MKLPILLNKKDLLLPLNQANERLEKIRLRKANNDDSIILEGLFVLSVSTFENSIIDTLRILFKHNPQKIDFKNETIPKEILLNENPITHVIEKKLNEISYKNVKEFIKYFINVTDIQLTDFSNTENFQHLQEIKATRNLLIHNDLKINSFYKETAGVFKRKPYRGKLKIDQQYLYNSIVVLRAILDTFITKLSNKFQDFTRIRALRELFEFIFKTPIMNFDDEWEIDIEEDRIVKHKENTSSVGSLSSSEKMFFDIWYSHIFGTGKIKLDNSFYNLDYGNREKFGYLISVIDIFKS